MRFGKMMPNSNERGLASVVGKLTMVGAASTPAPCRLRCIDDALLFELLQFVAPLELSRLRLVREEMNPNCGEFVDFVLGSAAAVERGRNAAIV